MNRRGRKTLIQLLALALVLLALPGFMQLGNAAETAQMPACYEHGDVNGDGKVDSRDAIRVLYHSLFEDDPEYAVNQDCNFNGDERVNAKDAIYVLYSTFSMFAEDYPLKGEIHQYYDPQWTWNEDGTVQADFQCACGEKHTLTAGEVKKGTEAAATCTEAGSVVYTATVAFDDQSYTGTRTLVIPAAGHSIADASVCESGVCGTCGETVEGMGHAWAAQEDKAVAATCTTPGTQGYKCANCGEEKTVTLEGLAEHAYVYVEDVLLEGQTCAYQKRFACACGQQTTGETFYKHTYTAALTKEATCQTEGEKTFTCADCGDSYTEALPRNDAHTWVKGETSEIGVTTYTCACGATKTAVCSDGNLLEAYTDSLKNSEMQISDVSLKLDAETLSGLGEQVQVQVGTADAAELGLDEDSAAQIGDNTVYDFDLSSDGSAVSQFDGKITISLPYTLQPGDDVDCIDVWFISDAGEVTCVQGTYANGSVTFTTDHFSYYTVTRLTPRQRCEHYGHVMNYGYKAPTCTAEGFDLAVCQRCGYEEKNETLPMAEHQFTGKRTEATCDTAGAFEEVCSVCLQKISGELPAKGHAWVLDTENSVTASCQNAGKEIYTCGACDGTYTRELPQLEHSFAETRVEPTCEEKGSVKNLCVYCKYETVETELAPLGHAYKAEDAVWTWAEDNSSAAVTLVCANDKTHTQILTAVVSTNVEGNETCGGEVTFTAAANYNRVDYTDSKTVDLTGKGHQAGAEWLRDSQEHYHACVVCQEKMDAAAHTWGEEIITKAPTCKEAGTAKAVCTVCGYEAESVIPPTPTHSYENGVCTVCGKQQNACDHMKQAEHSVDVTGLGLCEGTKITYIGCECGTEIYMLGYELTCDMVIREPYTETLPDGTKYEVSVETCADCGLTAEFAYYEVTDQESCITDFFSLRRLKKNGATIAELLLHEYQTEHAIRVEVSSLDAAGLGMCEGSFDVRSCACGEQVITEENLSCSWVQDQDDETLVVCAACGTQRKAQWTVTKDAATCQLTETGVITYSNNGTVLHTHTNVYEYTEHAYQVVDFTLEGETCEDGVYYTERCADCADEYSSHGYYHVTVERKVTDLTGMGYCMDTIGQYVCACGQEYGYFTSGSSLCSWYCIDEQTQEDGSILSTWECNKCDMIRLKKQESSAKDENCRREIINTYTFRAADGTVLAEVRENYWSTSHSTFSTVQLQEGSKTCEDGAVVKNVCRDCGWTSEYTTTGHATGLKETHDLKELGLCGGTLALYQCACGEDGWIEYDDSFCSWDYQDGDATSYTYICPDCQATRKETYSVAQVGSCDYRDTHNLQLVLEGVEVLNLTWNNIYQRHREVYELTLLGEDCEDGYTVVERCLQCDYSWDHGEYTGGHGTWAVKRERITDGQLCGEIDLVTYSCACGKETHTNGEGFGTSCYYGDSFYVESEDAWASTCTACGITRVNRYEETRGETWCDRISTDYYVFLDGEEKLFSYEVTSNYESHDYIYTYNLLGDSCRDGYTYTAKCADCGEVQIGNDVMTSEGTRVIQRIVDQAEGTCGRSILFIYACACGDSNSYGFQYDCDFEYEGYDSEMECSIYKCTDCGLERRGKITSERVSGSCDVKKIYDYTFSRAGEVLYSIHHTTQLPQHEYVASFDMLGEACEDGYRVTWTCARCQRSYQEEGVYQYHNTFRTEYYDLTMYGLCGGEIERNTSPCGDHSSWYWNSSNCSWSSTGKVDENTGAREYHCATCDTYRYYLEEGTVNHTNCHYEGKFLLKLVRDGETLLDISGEDRWESHEMVAQSFEMQGETCEEGYKVNQKCAFCDYSSHYTTSGHDTHTVEFIDLKLLDDTLCGGYISYGKCPCGKNSNVNWNLECDSTSDSWSEEGEDGRIHSFWEHSCDDCGIRLMRESFNIYDQKNCINTYYYTYTLSKGDRVIKTCNTQQVNTQHTYGKTTVSLLEGSVTCEDGIQTSQTCAYCGYVNTNTYHSHEQGFVSAIDLQPYGAVCETQLAEYACACGQYRRYELDGDMKCDMDRTYTSNFIPGTIDAGQDTTQGWVSTYSDSYIYTCAVTDPTPCAFKIRMSEYWLKDGCEVTQYQTWQLGYNEADGTFQKQVTLATGYSHAYHAYAEVYTREDLADGGYTDQYLDTCADCGSTYRETYTYDADGNQIRYEEEALNTLNNGENKRRFRCYEYGEKHMGYVYMTLDRYEYTYADGREYWYQYAYAYDFAKGCVCTTTYTSSNGDHDVWTGTSHHTSSTYETLEDSTCTQYGHYKHIETCNVCGQQTHECLNSTSPNNHSWRYDSEKEMYVCNNCGLENLNGASGVIVMEDMTDYENGTEYVVGYWNRENVEVISYVSVILNEAGEDVDNEILLTTVTVSELTEEADGVNAVSFNKADAEEAAAKAVADALYTGTYNIRFTFVPKNTEDTLDYAITFENPAV